LELDGFMMNGCLYPVAPYLASGTGLALGSKPSTAIGLRQTRQIGDAERCKVLSASSGFVE